MTPSGLERQLAFLQKIDRLKSVVRLSPPIERGAPALWEAAAGMAEAHYRKRSPQD